MRTALVTRPREDAEGIAAALAARGFAVWLEPLLDIVIRPTALPSCDGFQGVAATSANGVRALAANLASQPSPSPTRGEGLDVRQNQYDGWRDLPLWAVGDATAASARTLGFRRVVSAGGDVESLAALIAARADPQGGALLHVAGTTVSGDLAGRLAAGGFTLERVQLYEARTAERLSAGLCDAMAAGSIAIALFFSPRTAETFVRLAAAAALENACGAVSAYALSRAVAERLAPLPWRTVRVAEQPDQTSLLAAIDRDENGHDQNA